ncbi:hypothetical protein HY345_00655 [Candidatus Microgenomates bacterium]|nr:hypothetical protein [Candidatus Microgenomates bacterium]
MISILALFAQFRQPLGDIGDVGGSKGSLGPFGDAYSRLTSGQLVGESVSRVMSNVIGVMTTAAGIWFIIQFVVGTYKWITSGGEKQSVESAKNHLTQAVIGLAITVITFILTGIVGSIVGLDILNPQNIIPILKP